MRRRKTGDNPAKARRAKGSRRSAPKGARIHAAAAEDTAIARLTRERDEALHQQAATAEILKTIRASPADTQPVFEAIVQSGLKLFPDAAILIVLPDGDKLRAAAFAETNPARAKKLLRRWPVPLTREYNHAVAILDRKMVDIPDAREAPAELAPGAQYFLKTGYRAITIMPMMRDGEAIGALSVVRAASGTLSRRQIGVLRTFAAQAVIAIENARLLNELRGRTDDLSESLQQQTATSDVLKVISRSTFDLQTVFDTLVQSAARLCDAELAAVTRLQENNVYRHVASCGMPSDAHEATTHVSIALDRSTVTGRVALEKKIVHVLDAQNDPEFRFSETLKRVQFRSVLGVPLLREGVPIGVIVLMRKAMQPFTDKQIELVKTFADQAVIAIENVRLFDEVRRRTDDLSESLEQQTATAEVLKVISGSSGQLEPVFETMLANATRICEAAFGSMLLVEGDALRRVALHNAPPRFVEFNKKNPLIPLGQVHDLNRLFETRRPVHIADAAGTEDSPIVKYGGARSLVIVPMLKERDVVGVIGIYRQEVRPFTDKQIELVTNFAAQAVIAIENARLLNELRQRTDDLTESLEQQTATSEVLEVISSAPGELQPVFNAILENATRICGARIGILFRYEGGAYSALAKLGVAPAYAEYLDSGPIRPGRATGLGRVADTKQTIQIADTQAEQAYTERDPLRVATADLGGARSLLNVPMLKEGVLVGAIGIYRQEVRPFTDKQIELVTNFAAQAVIAIENTRLLNELRESLQQQTATADVLKVISSSPGDLEPVFEAILANATSICGAKFGTLYLSKDDAFYARAFHNAPPAFIEARRDKALHPNPESTLGRAARTKQVAQVLDATKREAYLQGDPFVVAGADLGGYRTIISVPMLKEDELIGAVTIYRQEVLAFTDKQVELVKNFAAQAVIAIENARLLNELRESLQQQTATSDVLKVISSSPGNLEPVFEAILASATQICQAGFGTLNFFEDGAFRSVALHNPPPEFRTRLGEIIHPHPDSGLAHVARTKQIAHIEDIKAQKPYLDGDPAVVKFADGAGARTLLIVPMLKDDALVGVISIYRQEVRRFTDKQIELVQNFAAQAVIAIENTRLLNELRESLQQQTATADVLKVISSSPGDLEPVFQAILANATDICGAKFGTLYLCKDDAFYARAFHNAPQAFVDARKDKAFHPSPETTLGRAARTKQVEQLVDIKKREVYRQGDPFVAAGADLGGFQTIMSVPMLKDDELIGAISIYRQEVLAFSDKQIELGRNFAAQAVIAIENTRLLNELRESLQQQTATSDVLKVISRSTFDLQTVLDTLVESAARLCGAEMANIWRPRDGGYRLTASYGVTARYKEYLENKEFLNTVVIEPGRGTTVGRVLLERKTVHIHDIKADPDYTLSGLVALGGYRTMLGVPILREGEPIGVFALVQSEVRPFTDKQVDLATTFADQAAIAIENVRLFDEVQARTRDLSESLQQQTATADVLKVISSSPGDLEPVFEAMLANAVRICDANFGILFRLQSGEFFPAAWANVRPTYEEFLRRRGQFRPTKGAPLDRLLKTKQLVFTVDERAESHPGPAAEFGGARSLIAVPMFKEEELIGAIVIYRQEVHPFTDRQVALVSNFANQAVIAIENARLLSELRESLQQQTATADVLKVISRSTFDLGTVLQTLVESASSLCDADRTVITRQKDGIFYRAETHGFSKEFMDHVRNIPITADRGSAFGRALLEKRAIHIPDVKDDAEYTLLEGQRLGDYRTVIAVPMLREDAVIGVLSLTRSEVRPFTEKQIELASTFADQAAIAIENVRLFENVEARTRELAASLENLRTTQDRLVQTQKLASLGQLTAGIAHEIKNPLNFVNNFSAISTELIDELQDTLKGISLDDKRRAEVDELTTTLRGNLDKVVQHGKRADGIVKNMLLHSREGSGEHRLVDINALVEESLNLAYHGARAEKQGFNITLERSFDAGAGEADLFPQDITRVLLNLIVNGFYAATKRKAEAGGNGYEPTLTAATRSLGDSVEIRIRDNGTGIPPDVKEKIFNPFFTTKPAGEGTGLGLSLSHDIVVKQHGGSIEVDTRPGEFTEFRVILPRGGAALAKTE